MKIVRAIQPALILLTGFFAVQLEAQINRCDPTMISKTGSGAPMNMMVFGDSVTWGDGLRADHRFSSIVAHSLSANHEVAMTVYAHSAAAITPRVGTPKPTDTWEGDVNSFYPLIADQMHCVSDEVRINTQLVLMNGCINDVDAFEIVNPATSSESVRRKTEQFCGASVRKLIAEAAVQFPNATIVVTGYFPIISEQSDISDFLDFLRQFFPATAKPLLQHQRGKMSKTQVSHRIQSVQMYEHRSAENSGIFFDKSNELLADTVSQINASGGNGRLHFVKVPFGPENAFGAPKSYLWPIPTIVSGFDESYMQRQIPCARAYVGDFVGFEACRVNAAAHPNLEGARVYANTILGVLAKAGF